MKRIHVFPFSEGKSVWLGKTIGRFRSNLTTTFPLHPACSPVPGFGGVSFARDSGYGMSRASSLPHHFRGSRSLFLLSVKGLNSGSEGVVTVDLILTVQKPTNSESDGKACEPRNGDTLALIDEAIAELDIDHARNPSHVYAHVLTKAIQKHMVLDDLHLGDVLVALRQAGYSIDRKSGLLCAGETEIAAA